MPGKVENLVVDTTAFLNNVHLQELGVNLFTTREIIDEVKNKRQLRRLAVLPYDLQVKDVDPECVAFITKFAKATGDYLYLSAADIKVLSLTYQLEKQYVGISHLKENPTERTLEPYDFRQSLKIPGFYNPGKEKKSSENDDENVESDESSDNNLQEVPDIKYKDGDDEIVLEKFSRLSCLPGENNIDQVVSDESDSEDDNNDKLEEVVDESKLDPCITDGDDAGWITPLNIRGERNTNSNLDVEDSTHVAPVVACLSTDFSIQNVLKQMGLNIISIDGRIIKDIRTFVLRCYACFHITPQTTRLFCPKCGNKTLKRVSVTVDADGKQHIEINFKRQITARGKKFPLPKPKGGKYAVNPILCEDQRVPQQRLSKLALSKNNPMDPDYIAGVSPFIMRDVSSRSAVVLATSKRDVKYWMRKNPNEVVKKKRKK